MIRTLRSYVALVILSGFGVLAYDILLLQAALPGMERPYDLLIWLRDADLHEASLSLMSQYSPQYRAREFPELNQGISRQEYDELVDYALDLGFEHLLVQGFESQGHYLPDFERKNPFEPRSPHDTENP